jgi:hypothetical protein
VIARSSAHVGQEVGVVVSTAETATVDLAERLADVARDTILNHRRALELGAGKLTSVTLELELTKRGEVAESNVFVGHIGAHRRGSARL